MALLCQKTRFRHNVLSDAANVIRENHDRHIAKYALRGCAIASFLKT